jgi:sulfur carrier protein ThiS
MHIRCGVYELQLDLSGRSVADLRRELGQALNIDPRAVAVVNGSAVGEEYVPAPTDDLEFVRAAGQKGSAGCASP